jgi:hypothetical protein
MFESVSRVNCVLQPREKHGVSTHWAVHERDHLRAVIPNDEAKHFAVLASDFNVRVPTCSRSLVHCCGDRHAEGCVKETRCRTTKVTNEHLELVSDAKSGGKSCMCKVVAGGKRSGGRETPGSF